MPGTAIGTSGGGGKVGDKEYTKGSRGVVLYAVRSDVAEALSDTDGDIIPIIVDNLGMLYVKEKNSDAILSTLEAILAKL